jgi:enamine deaminase RidA (YjgF/YER057c/UK114 family)
MSSSQANEEPIRIGTDIDPRFSVAVTHNGVVYLTGQTSDKGSTAKEQTMEILQKIEKILKSAGTDKSRLITAMVWVKDMDEDYKGMNEVWNAWVDPANKPTRASVEGRLARPALRVEIQVTAAARAGRSRL